MNLEEVLREFFPQANADGIHTTLHLMRQRIDVGELAMLPRPELAQRAYVATQYRDMARTLYQSLVETWGDDPNGWQLPPRVRGAVGDILALYLSLEAYDHTTEASVQPARVVSRRQARRRGRSGV